MTSGTLLKSGLWIALATLVTRMSAFLSSLVLARLLQPAEFGIIGIAYVFWSFFTLFTQDSAGTFIIYKGTENSKYVNTAYTVSLLIGLFFCLNMVAAAPWLALFFNEPALTGILIAFSFNLLLSSATYVYASVMTRHMQYRVLANISFVCSVTRLVFTIGAAWLGLSYWSFVIGDTAFWVINCVLTRLYSKYDFRLQIDREVSSEVIRFCLGTAGSGLGLYTNFNLDNFTVGKMLGSASLGYYNLAYQLTATISAVSSPILNQLGVPVFAQLPEDHQQKQALLNVVQQSALLTAPVCVLFFLGLTPEFVTLLFGAKWVSICTVIPGLLVFTYFRVINSPLYSMLVAKGRPDINAKVNLQVAPVAILSFIVGAQKGGIVGVSLAVATVLGFGWSLYWWWVGCRELKWPLKEFLIAFCIPLLLIIPGILISFKLPFIVRPIAFVIIYLLSLRIFLANIFFSYSLMLAQLIRHLAKGKLSCKLPR